MKSLVVEDSDIARRGLVNMLKHYDDIEVVGQAATVPEAWQLISKLQPEVLFLDIHLPGESAFELLANITYQPKLIFTTAYSEYALQSFDFSTVDYLLKPITQARLDAAIAKLVNVVEHPDERANASPDNREQREIVALLPDSKVFIRDTEQNHLVPVADIQLLESCKNHTRVYFGDHKPFIHRALSHVEVRLPQSLFFRVNRHQIVNLNHLVDISGSHHSGYELVLKNHLQILASRRQSVLLRERLSL